MINTFILYDSIIHFYMIEQQWTTIFHFPFKEIIVVDFPLWSNQILE